MTTDKMYTLNNESENILGVSYIVLQSEAQTLDWENKRNFLFSMRQFCGRLSDLQTSLAGKVTDLASHKHVTVHPLKRNLRNAFFLSSCLRECLGRCIFIITREGIPCHGALL